MYVTTLRRPRQALAVSGHEHRANSLGKDPRWGLGRPTIDSGGNRSPASDPFEQQLRGDEFIVGYDGNGSCPDVWCRSTALAAGAADRRRQRLRRPRQRLRRDAAGHRSPRRRPERLTRHEGPGDHRDHLHGDRRPASNGASIAIETRPSNAVTRL
jgi:hypothetical protein